MSPAFASRPRPRALVLLVAALLPGALLPGTADAASPPVGRALLDLDDVFELEWATDPRLSPDGDRVVYVRNFHDRMRDRRRGNLWLVDTDSGATRPLTSGLANHGSPRFSPDGRRLAWIAATEDGAEIFMHWFDGGATARLTQLPHAPRNLTFSPDGSQLAFVMHVDSEAKPMVALPSKPEGAEWAAPAKVIDRTTWRGDGQGILRDGFLQLFVMPADGGTPRQLTEGDFHHDGGIAWLPDGDALVVSANRNDDRVLRPLNRDLWRVDAADGALTQLTDRHGPETGPVVSPDGERIAFTGFEDRRQSHQVSQAWMLDVASGNITPVAPDLDRSVRDLAFADDGRSLTFAFTDQGSGIVARVDRRGRLTRLAEDLGGTAIGRPYAGGDLMSIADGRFVYTRGRVDRPADVGLGGGRAGRGDLVTLTDLNSDLLAYRDLASVEALRFPSSHDGTEIHGWLIQPPAAARSGDGPMPLILEIHGGPHTAYGPEFSAELQLMAAAGYAVLYLNPRGSTSYGEAFANAIQNAYPGYDYDDLMSGVDVAIERGIADPEQLYVTGGSGGGVLTAWIVGSTDRFRAAVVAKPVINWQSFALTADMSVYATRYWFASMPWEDPEHYWARSPLSLVGNVSTPTMLLTGEEDLRTPISESEQYYQALRLRGVDSVLVRVPGAGHGIAGRPTQLMTKVAHILAWFERHDGSDASDENGNGSDDAGRTGRDAAGGAP